MEGFGLRRKLIFKLKKNQQGFEATEMTPEFEKERKNYNDYRPSLAILTATLEAITQPNAELVAAAKGGEEIAYPEGRSPLEEAHTRLEAYKHHMSGSSLGLVEKAIGRAAKLVRDYQRRMSSALTPMRQFPLAYFVRFQQTMGQFDEAKDKMDLARHEVKTSNTTTEIEKKAVYYQEAVESFDAYCTQAMKVLEELPQIQQQHGKALIVALKAHRDYHRQMVEAWK